MAGFTQAEALVRLGIPTEPARHFSAMVGTNSTLRGTFVMNGATPVTVAATRLAADDFVIFMLNTPGGTVGAYPSVKTRTNGTGFTVAGTAADTSIYEYRIMKG